MALDIMILNTAVADLRGDCFDFAGPLAGAGGLARCDTEAMPGYTQAQYRQWIEAGWATAGGPGNVAPLLTRAGFKVAVGVNLGRGDFDGLDAQGRFFHDTMAHYGVDMSPVQIHPTLPTGTTFIHERSGGERGGIAYFPNANDAFDFKRFQPVVETLRPQLVYYMYSGLSRQGDANGGRDLAAFIRWCRQQGCLTLVDSHTLTGNPRAAIASGQPVDHYRLLEPLLGELDLFFTSFDEARMIANTLGGGAARPGCEEGVVIAGFLEYLAGRFWRANTNPRLFGVTVRDGAWGLYRDRAGKLTGPVKVASRFMGGEVIDLVGAGDSFRSGLIGYVCRHGRQFATDRIDMEEAIQMGNLFASLFIKSPLQDRYGHIGAFDAMLEKVRDGKGNR